MNYEEIRGDTGFKPETDPEPAPKKERSILNQSLRAAGMTTLAFTLGYAALKDAQRGGEQRKVRIEELRKELSEMPEVPFVTMIKPDDPERAAKEEAIRKKIAAQVELSDLERITPEN